MNQNVCGQDCRAFSLIDSDWLQSTDSAARICPGQQVHVRFLEWWQIEDTRTFLLTFEGSPQLRLDKIEPYSALIIYPPGLHFDMSQPEQLLQEYVQPIVDAAKEQPGTAIIILGVHSMGPKMPSKYATKQSSNIIKGFNRALQVNLCVSGTLYAFISESKEVKRSS